jgi:hypothetical protein
MVALLCSVPFFLTAGFRNAGAFELSRFIVSGTATWVAVSVGGALIAWPFVAVATWIGRRAHIESFAYYVVSGGLTMAILLYLIFGLPRAPEPGDFDDTRLIWFVGVSCGASWGGCWWHIHRR